MSERDIKIEEKYDASRSFATFLPNVDDGALEREATSELADLLAALENHALDTRRDAKGKITITLSFAVDEKGNASVNGEVTTKKPRPRRGASHFWLLKGKLSTRNPRQQELPLRDVSKDPPKVADPAAPTKAKEV